jgi:hypothetical protein
MKTGNTIMSRNLKLLIVLFIVATIAGYVVLVTIPSELAKRSYEGAKTLGEDIRKAFNVTPEVKVNNTIVLNQQTPLLELSVLSQNFEHRYVWHNSWLGSTKKISITGTFNAKVGFDLRQKFSITLRQAKAYVTLPLPRTLSVESMGDIEYRDENGIWNWVSIEDRTRATNAFITDARRYADKARFVQQAQADMEKELTVLLEPYAKEVVIDYHTTIRPR